MLTAAGRKARVGTPLDCIRCGRREMPEDFEPYKRTPVFSEATIPEGLRRTHATKRGVWGLIQVSRGRLDYYIHAPLEAHEVVTPERAAVVVPEVEHHVAAAGPVSFAVEFWRRAREHR